MTGPQVVAMVFGILAVVGGIQAAIWIPFVRRLRQLPEKTRQELAASGETVVRGPEAAQYCGSDGQGLSQVGGNGSIALTDRRLAIRLAFGRSVDLVIARIGGVREDKWFRSSYKGGRLHVIVTLRDGGELAFIAGDSGAWASALRQAAGITS